MDANLAVASFPESNPGNLDVEQLRYTDAQRRPAERRAAKALPAKQIANFHETPTQSGEFDDPGSATAPSRRCPWFSEHSQRRTNVDHLDQRLEDCRRLICGHRQVSSGRRFTSAARAE